MLARFVVVVVEILAGTLLLVAAIFCKISWFPAMKTCLLAAIDQLENAFLARLVVLDALGRAQTHSADVVECDRCTRRCRSKHRIASRGARRR